MSEIRIATINVEKTAPTIPTRVISMSNKSLKKIVYSHSTDLGIYNLANRIQCPIQSDPNKFQRTDLIAVFET